MLGTSKFELEDWMMYLLHVKRMLTSRHKGIKLPALLYSSLSLEVPSYMIQVAAEPRLKLPVIVSQNGYMTVVLCSMGDRLI